MPVSYRWLPSPQATITGPDGKPVPEFFNFFDEVSRRMGGQGGIADSCLLFSNQGVYTAAIIGSGLNLDRTTNTLTAVGGSGTPFPEAPQDGTIYGRQNAAWAGTLPEAPIDGQQYARENANWTVVTGGAGGGGIQYDVYQANGTWTKPVGAESVVVIVVGGGGGGGAGGYTGSANQGGGSGGGGAGAQKTFEPDTLPSTVAITVGAGGAGGAGGTTLIGNDGTGGGNSSFGTLLVAYGGGGASGGANGGTSQARGGSGGGLRGAGQSATSFTGVTPLPGGLYGGANAEEDSLSFGGAGGSQGGRESLGQNGFRSFGGGQGGGGGGGKDVGASYAGGSGQIFGWQSVNAGGASSGGDGVSTSGISLSLSGSGGGGGGGNKTGTRGGNGGAGQVPGGGGGGGGAAESVRSGNGGAGGGGIVVVITFFPGGIGGGVGTVTSVAASNGVETDSGVAITITGTVRANELVNAQTGTTYTVVTGDRGKLITHSNAASIAVTLPQAVSTFGAGWFADVKNVGAGTVTITPTTSTIDGTTSVVLTTNQSLRIISDGTNYQSLRGGGGSAGAVPYFIPTTDTFIVALYYQALFAIPLEVEGAIVLDGYLVEVD